MSSERKHLQAALDNDALIRLEWSDAVTLETLQVIEQVLAIQLQSVRKSIERRKAGSAPTGDCAGRAE